ncbi:MAG: amino acid permease [Pseudomonadota bacterium]
MADLNKTLTVWRGAALMLNIVLGAGLLALPGLAVQAVGKSALLVWAACVIAAAPLLVVFAILGRRYPDAGGIAAISKVAFGRFGYVASMLLFLGAVVLGLPAIALTGGHYASAMLGGSPHLYAIGLLLAAVLLNVISVDLAGRINAAIASLLIVILVAIAVVGLWDTPFSAERLPSLEGLPAVPVAVFGAAFMMVFFAFTGWEVGANLSGEFKNPKRDFPLAMALSFAAAIVLYGMLAIVAQLNDLNGSYEAPFSSIFQTRFGVGGTIAIGITAVLLIFANLSAAVWAVSRMVFSAAREGLFPAALKAVHNGMPYRAVLVTVAALVVVIGLSGIGLFQLDSLLATAGQNFLLLYAGAAAALICVSACIWHRVLGAASVLLVAALIAAHGLNGAVYPLALIAVAGMISINWERPERDEALSGRS